jgi:ABC-type transport system involved in multi-copper enzyme maturation permease subunit
MNVAAATHRRTAPLVRRGSGAAVIARKEAGELVLSGRGAAWLFALTCALSAFSLLLVSNTELSLLDNAEVVYDMAGIVTALGALLAVATGVDAIAGERERGSLVPLLLTPVSRTSILLGKIGGQAAAWAAMYLLSLPYLWAVGSTGQNLGDAVLAVALFGTPVVLGFGFLAMGLAALLGSARASLATGLILVLLSATPLVLGPSLRQSTIGVWFDAVNPLSAALNAYDAIIIDSLGIGSQFGHLAVAYGWLGAMLIFAVLSVSRIPG